MGDELDRHFVHPPLEPALGDEAVAEARSRQMIGEPQAQRRRRSRPPIAPCASAMSPATAPSVRQKRSSAALARLSLPVERRRPQFLFVVERERRGPRSRRALRRCSTAPAPKRPARPRRGESCAASATGFGPRGCRAGRNRRARPRSRSPHNGPACGAAQRRRGRCRDPRSLITPWSGSGRVGAADVANMLVGERRHGMSDRAEIVDEAKRSTPEPLLDQRRPDDPRIVGQLEHLAADRPGEGHRQLVRQARSPARAPNSSHAAGSSHARRSCSVTGSPSDTTRPPSISAMAKRACVPPTSATAIVRSCPLALSIAASIADAPASASLGVHPHQREQLAARCRPAAAANWPAGRDARSTPTASSVPAARRAGSRRRRAPAPAVRRAAPRERRGSPRAPCRSRPTCAHR